MTCRGVPLAALTLKYAVCWWLALTFAALVLGLVLSIPGALLPGDASGDLAMALPFFGGLMVFPVVAVVMGWWLAERQRKALGAYGAQAMFAVGHERTLDADLPAEQLRRIAESALTEVLRGATLTQHPMGLSARVSDPSAAGALWPALHEDAVVATITANGEDRGSLRIPCTPRHAWLYATLLADRGRCARQVDAVVTAVQDRLRAQSAAMRELQAREASRARQTEAELAMLRAHVEPHFLFNTLAHIKAGIATDPAVSDRMLDALIGFLRSNSQAFQRIESRLDEELAMVGHYLAIIQLRVGDRLRYDLQCPADLGGCRIPSAGVLVLVENAVKHGIERTPAGGGIRVHCSRQGERLVIACENDGPPFVHAGGAAGGLGNLQERLRLMYGRDHALEVENLDAGGVRVTVSLPAREGEA